MGVGVEGVWVWGKKRVCACRGRVGVEVEWV